ncbi:MAG: hypothetical protein J1E32_08035 [Treponema sp.]|nr:hypothetical protein [Treponema sp.]
MRKMMIAAGALLTAGSLFAYNPPSGGQNLLRLSSPFALTGANSAAGGALYEVIPSSVLTNPALSAAEQRISIDAGFTFMTDSNKNPVGGSTGTAFQLGATFPTRWCVPTFLVQGVFAPLVDMHLGNNILGTVNVAKDINDKVSVGIGVTSGGFWNDAGSDWTFYANTGVFYNHGELAFMKDVRFAVTLVHLGKMYSDVAVAGIKKDTLADDWPGLVTPHAGVAALLVDTGDFRIGGSTDIAVPGLFQDFVIDLGIALEYSELGFATFKLASAWEFDVQEFRRKRTNVIPCIGLSVKFNFNANNEVMASHGWAESEITAAGAWRNLYEDVNAFSAGIVLKLGLEDTDPPAITLWEGEK